ncbi:MAG TPA: hypothetical protein VF811_14820 [Parasulfuritortus sp.]
MSQEYIDRLNRWHLDLAILQSAFAHLVSTLIDFDLAEGPDSIARVLSDRLDQLVQSCPFPSSGQPSGGHSCVQAGVAAEEFQP